ncbi:MAG: ABC transporter ATP-binding protein [Firmicutes bacterium]|nr:ABC transporter ATP-binding protein [Bacillota bacterium]
MNELLKVCHLSVSFPDDDPYDGIEERDTVIRDLSFSMEKGDILGVVGESGSGKSMTALSVIRLLKKTARIDSGEILFQGKDLFSLSEEELCDLRGLGISMIFQEPMTSLNPVLRIEAQVAEAIKLHAHMNSHDSQNGKLLSAEEVHQKVIRVLTDVGLPDPEGVCRMYPHELSGGMRQRVMIAAALITDPSLLIADEPTTALDVLVQEQILDLLKEIHERTGVAILFISHDLHVIRRLCDRVLVMYQGQIVEEGEVKEVLDHPKHEYTKTLVARIPSVTTIPGKDPVLQMDDVTIYYPPRGASSGLFRKAKLEPYVYGASLKLFENEILGIVGGSGSGKSTIGKVLTGLHGIYDGTIQLFGKPLTDVLKTDQRPQMIFQDPYSALNPAHTIGWTLMETLRSKGIRTKEEQQKMALEMLKEVGLPETIFGRYPRDLSGGQRQRCCIGQALLYDPRILIADEPVSALDVTVSSQVLELLLKLQKERNMSMIFVSHDMNIVRMICHRVIVLEHGRIVEEGSAEEIFEHPKHPYTQKLIRAAMLE